MLEFEILARGLFHPHELEIAYDPSLRMPTEGLVVQEWIDALWQQQLAIAHEQSFPLFDAPLFRLIKVEVSSEDKLHLVLGDTTYKEYTVTRLPTFSQRRERQQLSNPLAVCSVVETSDDFILYEQRQNVAVHAGRYHVIAGFFEREQDKDIQGRPDPFGAMCRELREETGIQPADIKEQYCLGAVYDVINPHGELCFLTRLHISLAEVLTRTPEDDEVKKLRFLAVTDKGLRDFLLANHGNISATGEPNLLMYGGWKFGEGWFEEVIRQLDSPALND